MRFDYQPAFVNIKFINNPKQKKLFFLVSLGFIGCFVVLSAIAHNLITYKKRNEANNSPLLATTILPIADNSNRSYPAALAGAIAPNKSINFEDIKATLESNQPKIDLPVTEHKDDFRVNSNLPQNFSSSLADLANWKVIKLNSGDNLINILKHLNMPAVHLKDLHNFINTNSLCKSSITNIKAGFSLKVLFDSEANLQSLILPLAAHKSLYIERIGPKNYKSYYEEKPIIRKLNIASNKVMGSFYASAQAAGLNDSLIMEIAEIFGWDIDFSMDLRPHDRFRVLYEEKFVDQEKIGTGHIIAAEFINQGQKYQAIRFVDAQGRASYYTPEGYSMNKTFLRNPVKFTRIGSKFSISRHHPILHRFRAHKGVDYVAPGGTPVKAAGDGKVVVIGSKGGYGNVVELLHGNKYSTLYAHLSRFAAGISKDQMVKQGQVIGYVGKTGLATGDHLHYEFRVDGVHRDPLTVQLPRSTPLASKYRTKFLVYAQQMISSLNVNNSADLQRG